MKEWIESLVDDPEKRASFSILAGALSLVMGAATFLAALLYPVSAFMGVMGLLLSYPSLNSKRPWQAVLGLILSGLGLLLPVGLLMFLLFGAR